MFKIGDKVRCIDDKHILVEHDGVHEKGIYEVIDIGEDGCIKVMPRSGYIKQDRFELVKEEQQEPKQGEMIEGTNNDWINCFMGKYMCKYESQYIIDDGDEYRGISRAEKIRPIQQKETPQSVYKELQHIASFEFLGGPTMDELKSIVKRISPFISQSNTTGN